MKLEEFNGMTWDEAGAILMKNHALLALSSDRKTRECAVAIREQGLECGVAILCASLFLKENGASRTINRGISIYKEILKKLEEEGQGTAFARSRIDEIEGWTYWLRVRLPVKEGGDIWPIEFPFEDCGRKAGIANVMLMLSARDLNLSMNSERIMAIFITNFLKDGLKRMQSSSGKNCVTDVQRRTN